MTNGNPLHSTIFSITDKIGLTLNMAEAQPTYKAKVIVQSAEIELDTLKRLNVSDKRLRALVVELLEGAIANTQYPNTMRAEFTLGQKLAWAMAENRSYLEIGAWLFEEMYPLVKRDKASMSEPEHAKRNTLVMAIGAWILSAHRHLELHEIEKLPQFHDVYCFVNGLA